MRPALQRAFNDDPTDDRLPRVFGPRPKLAIAGLIAFSIGAGLAVSYGFDGYWIKELLNWPAVASGLVFAVVLRRYLFSSGEAKVGDFPWLAAVLIPAAAAPALVSILTELWSATPQPLDNAPAFTVIGSSALLLIHGLGVAAAFTIAVAALCYSRNWLEAVSGLAVQLFIFKLMVWVTLFVLVEIGIVGPILARIVEGVFGINVPGWIGDFVDQLTTVVVLGIAYMAIIGATWTVCRKSFGELLETGDVRILHAIEAMTRTDKQNKKQAAKAQAKQEKTARKAAKKAAKTAAKAAKKRGDKR